MSVYYVRKDGSNGNALSEAAAKTTIAAAASLLAAGDILDIGANVGGGSATYTEGIYNTIPSGISTSLPTIVRKATGHSVIINGVTPDGYVLRNINRSYITFTGLIFDGANAEHAIINSGTSGGLGESGCHFIVYEDLIVRNLTHSNAQTGIAEHGGGTIGGPNSDYTYRRLEVFNIIGSLFQGAHGIYPTSANCLIEDCHIYSTNGWGIHCNGGSNHNGIYRRNRIHNVENDGIRLSGGDVSGNNNKAYNNIIYSCEDGITLGWGTNNQAYNNTVYACSGRGIWVLGPSTSAVVINNIQYLNGTNYQDDGSGTTHHTNLEGVNPLFVDAANGDFRLQAGSPAIDTAVDLSQHFQTDFFGNARV